MAFNGDDNLIIRDSDEKTKARRRRAKEDTKNQDTDFAYDSPTNQTVSMNHQQNSSGFATNPFVVKPSKMEETSVESSNVKIQSESGSFEPAPADNGGNPRVHINKTDGSECLLHKISGKDTLQGLSLRYGVEISELKKINKLWRNDDIFARKELTIPTTMEAYLQIQANQQTSGTKQSQIPQRPEQRQEIIAKFREVAKCDEDVAVHYLELKRYNFSKALGFFYSEQEKISQKNGSSVPVVALDDLEIWTDEEARAKQMKDFDNLSGTSAKATTPVMSISANVRNRLAQNSEKLFDL